MKKISMDKNWKYLESELKNKLLMNLESGWKETDLPHDYGLEKERSKESLAGVNEGYTQGAALYYKKEFKIADSARDKRFILEFEGIAGTTTIWFNGEFVAKHLNPFTGIWADVTKYVKYGAENQIMVVTDNRAKPSSRWYTGTGIYRHVWMHMGEKVGIKPDGLKVVTKFVENDTAKLLVTADLENITDSKKDINVLYEVIDLAGTVVATKNTSLTIKENEIKEIFEIEVHNAKLWDIKNPNLYTLRATVSTNQNESNKSADTNDVVEIKFGIRTISATSTDGFNLNGTSMKLKGGCIHADLGILGAASYDAAEYRKIKLLKEFGFNAVRLAHNPYAPGILQACDELGMLVIAEAFDEWVLGRTSFGHYTVFEYEWEKDLENMISRDFNHPSIIMWSIGNEVEEREGAADGFAWSKRLADKVKSLDPYRYTTVTACSLFSEYMSQPKKDDGTTGNQALNMATDNFASGVDLWGDTTRDFFEPVDIAGYNYKTVRYEFDKEKFPDRVIYGSETYPLYSYESWESTLNNTNVIGDFVWTAMDYIGEIGIGRYAVGVEGMPPNAGWPWLNAWCGDIDFIGENRPQGEYRRRFWEMAETPYIAVLPPDYYGKSIARLKWTWDPVKRSFDYKGFEGCKTEVQVYCNGDEVELFHNGQSIGRKLVGVKEKNRALFEIIYEPGDLKAVAYKDGKPIGEDILSSSDEIQRLVITADRDTYLADGKDLAFLTIHAVDKKGNKVTVSNDLVHLKVEGKGTLLSFGNADPKPEEIKLFKENTWKLYEGSALAVIKSKGEAGSCKIIATMDGSITQEIQVEFKSVIGNENGIIIEVKTGPLDMPIHELLKNEKWKAVLNKYIADFLNNPSMARAQVMSIRKLNGLSGGTMFAAEVLEAIERELQ